MVVVGQNQVKNRHMGSLALESHLNISSIRFKGAQLFEMSAFVWTSEQRGWCLLAQARQPPLAARPPNVCGKRPSLHSAGSLPQVTQSLGEGVAGSRGLSPASHEPAVWEAEQRGLTFRERQCRHLSCSILLFKTT